MKAAKNSIKSLVHEYNNHADCFQVRNQAINAYTEVTPHTHQSGQLNIINSGIMEVEFSQYAKLVSPWQYAIWIPAGILHSSYITNVLSIIALLWYLLVRLNNYQQSHAC